MFSDLRRLKGISQRELARRSGVSQGTISKIEAGGHVPHGSTVRDLARGLGVSEKMILEALADTWSKKGESA